MIKIVVGANGAEEVEMTPEEISEWQVGQASFSNIEPPAKTKLYKSTFIRRLSFTEAATLEEILIAEDAWLRMLYHSIEYFMMDDALIMYLFTILSDAFGEDRAHELLEPEE